MTEDLLLNVQWVFLDLITPDLFDLLTNLFFLKFERIVLELRSKIIILQVLIVRCFLFCFLWCLIMKPSLENLQVPDLSFFDKEYLWNSQFLGHTVQVLKFSSKLLLVLISEIFIVDNNNAFLIYIWKKLNKLIFI